MIIERSGGIIDVGEFLHRCFSGKDLEMTERLGTNDAFSSSGFIIFHIGDYGAVLCGTRAQVLTRAKYLPSPTIPPILHPGSSD